MRPLQTESGRVDPLPRPSVPEGLKLFRYPLIGAMAGEYWARRDTTRAAQVGLATWLGLLIGTVVKLVLVFVMIGIFALAYWI